jgi:nitrogen regulatory protein PII
MQTVNKVEIIISTLEIEEVIEILERVSVSGYTLFKDVSGKGDRGISYNDLGREFSNSYITVICTTEEQLHSLVDELRPLLKRVGGVCLVTPANWVTH